MKHKILTFLLLLIPICGLMSSGQAQEIREEFYRTPVPENSRWHIFQAGEMPGMRTFLLDKYNGTVWVMVAVEGQQRWRRTAITGRPQLSNTSKVNYQIFLSRSGRAGFYLLCVENGFTWFLARDDDRIFAWQQVTGDRQP